MNLSKVLVYLHTSKGNHVVLCAMGLGDLMWCNLKDKNGVGGIVSTWRAGTLHVKNGKKQTNPGQQMAGNLVNVWDGNKPISIFQTQIGRSELRMKFNTRKKTKWRNFGIVDDIELYPLDPESNKSDDIKSQIVADIGSPVAKLDWEVLPPGWWRSSSAVGDSQSYEHRLKYDDIERIKFIDSLHPKEWHRSKEESIGFRIYYVAIFTSCVVAESPSYGNPVYVVFDMMNWKEILAHTKWQVLKLEDNIVSRVLHTINWRSKLIDLVNRKAIDA